MSNIQLSEYYLDKASRSTYVPSRKQKPQPVKAVGRPVARYTNIPTYFGIGDELHNKNLEPYKSGRGLNSEYRFA